MEHHARRDDKRSCVINAQPGQSQADKTTTVDRYSSNDARIRGQGYGIQNVQEGDRGSVCKSSLDRGGYGVWENLARSDHSK